MNFINPLAESPQYITHKTFYSQALNHDIGYNIYLPPEYEDSGDDILVDEIVNVCADEQILTDGRIDPKKLKPITYDPVNSAYIGLGEKVGNAFRDGLIIKNRI